MNEERYTDFWTFLRLLSENQLLEHVVLIGSWAEYIYAQAGILKGFEAELRTLDIDFLVKNLKRPTKAVSLEQLAKESGYIIDRDILNNTTKIYSPGFMEIEFLIAQQGSGAETVIKTNLGVNAQALRHMSVIKENVILVELFGMKINVPSPESYVIHKMIINNQRGPKQEKDAASIVNLLKYIDVSEYERIMQNLTKKEKKKVEDFQSGLNAQ
ncbi:MAG: hypothetical protein HUJ75_05625 [Parasporobacterium sp.]|nr:hypothetical protein [Parasporobacterium sp.]